MGRWRSPARSPRRRRWVQGTLASAGAWRAEARQAAAGRLRELLPAVLAVEDAAGRLRSFAGRRAGRFHRPLTLRPLPRAQHALRPAASMSPAQTRTRPPAYPRRWNVILV